MVESGKMVCVLVTVIAVMWMSISGVMAAEKGDLSHLHPDLEYIHM